MSRRTSLDKPGRDRLKNPVPSRGKICPVVPLSRDNEGTSVPLFRKVALSRPVGNPNSNPERLFKVRDYVISFLLLFIFELTLKKIIKHYFRAKPKLELMENQAGFMTGTTKSQINLSAKQRRDAANVVIKLPR